MSLQAEIGRLRPSLTVVVCFCIAGLEGFDIQAFGVAAPQLASDLHLSPGQMGWAGSAAMIGLALGALLGGGLADRWGRRPILAGSVALFGLFSLGTAMAETYHILLAARFLTGLGFGGAMPNLIAIATEISAPNRRAATTTSMFCGLPTGGALVALIAKAGGAGLDWRILFLIGGAAPLILAPMVMRLLPETQSRSEKLAPRSVATSLFGAATRTSTLLIWLVLVLDLLVTYLLLNWLPTLVVAKGYASSDGADAAVWFNGFSILGALILGQAADRLGYRAPVTLGFIGLAFGLYGLANAASLPAILAFSALSGFLAIGLIYVLFALAPTLYPSQVRAAASGAAVAVSRLGSILGPVVAGQMRANGFGPSQVLQALVPAALVAAVAGFVLLSLPKTTPD